MSKRPEAVLLPATELQTYTLYFAGHIEEIMHAHRIPPWLVLDRAHRMFSLKFDIVEEYLKTLSKSWGIPLRFDPENKEVKDSLKKLGGEQKADMLQEISRMVHKLEEVPGGRIYMIICGVIDAETNTSLLREFVATKGDALLYQVVHPADLRMSPEELLSHSTGMCFAQPDASQIDRYLFARALKTGELPVGIDNLTSPHSLYTVFMGESDHQPPPPSV